MKCEKKVGLARKSRGCVWYMFVNSTVPFHHRWVEEKGGNLNPEYFLSLHAINSIALLCTYRVVYCSTFEKEYMVISFLKNFMQNALCNVHIIFKLFHISYFYKPLYLLQKCMVFPLNFGCRDYIFFHCWFIAVANIILSYAQKKLIFITCESGPAHG